MSQSNNIPPRKQRLNLPFVRRRFSPANWVFNHRAALLTTLIVYLGLLIVFISSNIVIESRTNTSQIMVDFEEMDRLQEELERAQQLNRMLNEQRMGSYDDLSNDVSNENGEFKEEAENHFRNPNTKDVFDEAARAQARMRANADSYRQGLLEEQQMRNESGEGKGSEGSTSRKKGHVTGSYSLSDPVRSAVRFTIPSYRCEGGGQITVNITVNQNGEVVAAEVDAALSDNDNCMKQAALDAARESLFNVDLSAPSRQKGTITYTFRPQ